MVRSLPMHLAVSKHHSLVTLEYLEGLALETIEQRVRIMADVRVTGDDTKQLPRSESVSTTSGHRR